jgi:hypothetical protein
MLVSMLKKEDVVNKEEDDSVHTDVGLNESIGTDDKRIEEEGSQRTDTNSGESIDDIRRKIVDFIKSQGYAYSEGEREFDDETNDIFTKGGTLVELAITIGIDNEVIKQIVEEGN